METREIREIINMMNRHKSIKETHMEVVGDIGGLLICLGREDLQMFKAEEISHVLIALQRLIELHNLGPEVKKATEEYLTNYVKGGGEA